MMLRSSLVKIFHALQSLSYLSNCHPRQRKPLGLSVIWDPVIKAGGFFRFRFAPNRRFLDSRLRGNDTFTAMSSVFLVLIAVFSNIAVFGAEKQQPNQYYFRQLQEIFELVNKNYVQEPDRQKMIDAAINGMLTSLDPHSNYFTDEEVKDFIDQTKGEFGGIGVEVISDSNAVKVISPIDDLPAYKAGIKAGDYIIGVNDELVSTMGFNKAIKEMRGEPGTKVKLLVMGEHDVKPREVEVTRDIVKFKPVKAHIEGNNIAYVRIVTFNESTGSELRKAFKKIQSESKGGVKGIILDLRNNPGGLLNQAISVSEYFIDSGIIVSTKGRISSGNSEFFANKFVPKAPDVPMVVLVNGGSASASEIVAGALQDHKRAILLGTKSFGKGSVQTFIEINNRIGQDKARAAVKMTTAKYYTPSGRSIQAEGIEPDIIIEPAKVEYAKADILDKRFSESSLKNYLKNEQEEAGEKDKKTSDDKQNTKTKEATTTKPDKEKTAETESDLYKKDYQFARAYDLIRGLIISKGEK